MHSIPDELWGAGEIVTFAESLKRSQEGNFLNPISMVIQSYVSFLAENYGESTGRVEEVVGKADFMFEIIQAQLHWTKDQLLHELEEERKDLRIPDALIGKLTAPFWRILDGIIDRLRLVITPSIWSDAVLAFGVTYSNPGNPELQLLEALNAAEQSAQRAFGDATEIFTGNQLCGLAMLAGVPLPTIQPRIEQELEYAHKTGLPIKTVVGERLIGWFNTSRSFARVRDPEPS